MRDRLRILKINIVFAILICSIYGKAQNPILHREDKGFVYAADPSAEVFNDTVYVYCSRDIEGAVAYSTMQDYVVLSSADMKT